VSKVKFINLSMTLFLLAGCAQLKKITNTDGSRDISADKTAGVEPARVQENLIEDNLKTCRGCIPGSVGDQELLHSDKKVYFLYGAEHLGLENNYFDIPVVYNPAVKKWINYYTGRGRKHFRRYAERAGRYAPVLSKILNDQGLPRDLLYLSMNESGFRNDARSWAKAVGPWQFMSFTGRKFGLEVDFFLDERRDPLKATVAASMYLRYLYDMFDSWELAMTGYNAGEGKMRRAVRRYRTTNFWKIRKGRYLKAEQKNYVPKIMALAIIGKNLRSFGFSDVEFSKTLDFEEITVPANTDLYKVSDAVGTSFDELKKYNPELVRWQTPPTGDNYILRIPVGHKTKWDDLDNKQSVVANSYKTYQLRGYASLKHVGRKFKVPTKILEEINGIPASKRLFPKTTVYLPFREDHTKKHRLYADLYEKPRKSVMRRRRYQKRIRLAKRRGKYISNPKEFYIVQKGDTLWNVARKTGVSMDTIIRSNLRLVKRRMVRPGDKLAIR
jgi:membrane-bound lytic murein transglycosylase D